MVIYVCTIKRKTLHLARAVLSRSEWHSVGCGTGCDPPLDVASGVASKPALGSIKPLVPVQFICPAALWLS